MSLANRFSISIFSVLLFLTSLTASAGGVSIDLSLSFEPATIGPGSTSRLVFTFDNIDTVVLTDIAVTDNLPANVTIAAPANVESSCIGANVSAPDGGTVISISDASLGVSESCTVAVNVTSATAGVHMNTTGSVTSSGATGTAASADLTVVTTLPGFSKSFSPSAVTLGSPSTLTFTIDNALNAMRVGNLDFTDVLPVGMIVASPANSFTDCISASVPDTTLTAVPGSNQIILNADGNTILPGFEVLPPGATCTVTVDVVSGSVGSLMNQSNNLLADFTAAGFAVDTLDVSVQKVVLSKDFIDDPVAPGGTATLNFTILNTDRNNATSNMAFTDDLDATLSGLVAVGLPQNDVCGLGSSITGTGLISLTGGNLPPEGMCSFNVVVEVPAVAVPGVYPNTSSSLTGDLDGLMFTSAPAVSNLFVQPIPALTKTFLGDPVGAGSDATLEFVITNSSLTSSATAINFIDELTTFLPFPVSVTLPATPCGMGSSMALVSVGTDRQGLSLTGGDLAPGASCTFTVDITIPDDLPNGTYINTTEVINATVDTVVYTGLPASDDLIVVAAPQLTKIFTDDPVQAGSTVNLEFTLSHDATAAGDATAITFTDDLGAALSGLTATGLPLMDICGMGSQITGTTSLTFSGGTLMPGESCTFNLTLQVPAAAVSGNYTNTTSAVNATILGVAANANVAEDVLTVANVLFTKTFLNNPVQPGASTILEFTVENLSTFDATGLFFTDNLGDTITGLASTSVVSDTCGGTPAGVPSTSFIYTGGTVLAGQTCTVQVDLTVPAMATNGNYINISSNLTATIDGNVVVINPAVADLEVTSDLFLFTKTFTDDPVAPGGLVTLEFTIENIDTTNSASNIVFTDNLNALIPGWVATGLPLNDVCGSGSQISGTGLLTLSGGNLPAAGSCTFSVTLQVPAMVPTSTITNTTSAVTGTINGLPATGDAASDDLSIQLLTFNKSFDGATTATGTPVLTYTIENLDTLAPSVDGFMFSDNLDDVVSGLVATGLPLNNTCGIGSVIAGTSLLTFTGGNLLASETCTIMVPLSVPASAPIGTFPSTSTDLTLLGLSLSGPATADLIIEPAPTVFKSFAPASIGIGQTSVLELAIDNAASSVGVNNMSIVDNLPAGMELDILPVVSNTCGGILTANSGASVVSLNGGVVLAGESCVIQVRVVGIVAGVHTNVTNDVTSSSGNSGTASDDLTVNPQPLFSKSFAPNPAFFNTASTLQFSIDNSASTVVASSLGFIDTLPADMVVATPPNAVTTCSGGTLTAAAGTSTIIYISGSVSAGGSCTVSVDVTTNTAGPFTNVSGDLTSNLGNSGNATDTIVVNAPPAFTKQFNPVAIRPNDLSQLTFVIDNTASTVNATSLDFTDNLPAALIIATPANASTTCSGGTLTAVAGSSSITYTGGLVNTGASCTISVDVTSSVVGNHVNLTGDLTSNHGNSGPATDNLLVANTPLLSKSFANNPYILNSSNTLTFTIDNTAGAVDISGLGFTDSMPLGFEVATPANAINTCTGGTLNAVSGSNTITYSGGTVSASSSCTLSVDVRATVAGQFTNITSVLSTSLGDGNSASTMITINPPPGFAKVFNADIIASGETSRLTFTIDNALSTVDATGLSFVDNLPTNLVVATPANVMNSCSGTVSAIAGTAVVDLTGGTVTTAASCELAVDVTSSLVDVYTNTTNDLTSNLGNSGTATDILTVIDLPVFSKSFTNDPSTLNTTNTLVFSIDNTGNSVAISGLGFNDAMPTGFQVANPANVINNCTGGVINAAVGSNNISYSGGAVNGTSTCVISVDIIATVAGSFTNTTSVLTTDLGDSNLAVANITINPPPLFAKMFTPAIMSPGGVSTLSFDIDNSSSTASANNFAFIDNLPANLVVAPSPNIVNSCTGGNIVANAGSGSITVTNGSLPAGSTCQISVDVSSSVVGVYTNITGDLTSDLGNSGTATADLNVVAGIVFNKSYADFVLPGGDVQLSFVLENNTNTDANNITFSDNLTAVVLTSATNLPLNDVCGLGSQMVSLAGGLIQLTGGILASGETCQIDVTVQIDESVAPGVYTNVTSSLSADFNLNQVITPPASADFTVVGIPVLSKDFIGGAITAGDTVELNFSITNNSTVDATAITFSDDLTAFIAGSTALNLPQNDICGLGSSLTGTTTITLQDGLLPANSSCQFSVIVEVPASVISGNYINITSPLDATFNGTVFSGGSSSSASSNLIVNGIPVLIPVLSGWKSLSLMVLTMLLLASFLNKRRFKSYY